MPRQIISTSALGLVDMWSFAGAATSWQAVQYGSSDSSYVYSSTAWDFSDFYCGNGELPLTGTITGVTIHYRIRTTVPLSGALVQFFVSQGGWFAFAGAFAPTDTWTDGEFRIRDNWNAPGTRLTMADVSGLGVDAFLVVAPAAGDVLISQLWLEVETIDTPYRYDPFAFGGALPDAVIGPLNWFTVGAEPATVTWDNYLEIADASLLDGRLYGQFLPFITFRDDYVTEFEVRVTLSSSSAGDGYVATLCALYHTGHVVDLAILMIGPDYYIGLLGNMAAPWAIASYPVRAPLDLLGNDTHFRIVIDRDADPSTYGNVSVYVNYSSTPLLECAYHLLPEAAAVFGVQIFGVYPPPVGNKLVTILYDYIAIKTYKKRGYTFRSWREFDLGTNSVYSDSADPDIVKHVTIDPPGVVTGQSNNVCVLDVVQDTELCQVYQTVGGLLPWPIVYSLTLDYKMIAAPGNPANLFIQRTDNLWYYDILAPGWTPIVTAVPIPHSATRVRTTLVNNLSDALPFDVIVTIQNGIAAVGPHQVLVYRVYLAGA